MGQVDWTGRLDLDHLGLFGHSTGGGTALEVCGQDPRCDAALGLDVWVEPVSDEIRAAGLRQPLLFLSAPDWISEANQRTGQAFYAASDSDRYLLTVAGSDHFDFTDFPGFSPLTPYLGVAVTNQGATTQAAVQAYTLAFFNHYLRGTPEPLLTGPSPKFPTIDFQRD
jgi:predicted dienelactone hydrolase